MTLRAGIVYNIAMDNVAINRFNIAVCDDEADCICNLEKLLQKYFPEGIEYELNEFACGEELLKEFDEKRLDILFMDIELKNMNGIETVRRLKEKQPDCTVFFVTSHNSYIADAFRLNSFQFLQKPINEDDFKVDIVRAVKQCRVSLSMLIVEVDGVMRQIPLGEIYCTEIKGRHIEIRLKDSLVESAENIKRYEGGLIGYGFAKTHYSFIVNMRYITEVGKDYVLLSNGVSVPLSRRYRNSFIQEYHKYCIGRCL